MDARTPRTHLTPHTPRPEPTNPPVVTQRHHTEHSPTQAECLRWVEESAQASSDAPIRFDGIYVTDTGESRTCLRFFKAGIACVVSSAEGPDEVANILSPINPDVAKGTFTFSDESIEIEIDSDEGFEVYSGAASKGGLQLHLYAQADVSKSESFAIWRFARIVG